VGLSDFSNLQNSIVKVRMSEECPYMLVFFLFIAGCHREDDSMSSENLPEKWNDGDVLPDEKIYSDPPPSNDPSQIQFFGMREGDSGHRLYSVPAKTSVAEIVTEFEVGSHGAMGSGYNVDETVRLVAGKASQIAELIPLRVVFADSAELKLKFERQITSEELAKIEGIFPEEEAMQAGLEHYLSEWDGESSLLAPVLVENLFHFWWD